VFGTAKIEIIPENTKFSEKIFNFAVPYGLRETHLLTIKQKHNGC
jgi:hypothetical protein